MSEGVGEVLTGGGYAEMVASPVASWRPGEAMHLPESAAVRTLVNDRRQAGLHRVDWDGHNDRGQPIASGVYFYKLVAGSFTDTKKMTILK